MEMNLLDDDGWLPRTWPPEGDCIHFPSGEAGAHQVTNRAESEARVLFVSNFSMPRGAVQPDSQKMMIRWGAGNDERAWFPLDAATDYGEGEPPPNT